MSDDEKLLALLKKLPTELAIPVLKLSLKIDRLVEERDQLRAAIEADREGLEGYEERWMAWHPRDGDARIKPTEESAKRIADQWNGPYGKDSDTIVVRILVPTASPEPDKETP